ncbi:hypothetical protein KKD88_03245, partial [Patescibacteria group bacterium]|nr:hypothetical protein [Patescibacteria group bacterium]
MAQMDPQIGGGFTEGEIKLAGFWVRHGRTAQRVGYGLLIGVNAVLWLYVLWGILDAFAISYPRESRLTQEIAFNQQTLDALERDRPQNIASGNPLVFEITDNRYDMVVDLENQNEQWWAEFNYRFNLSGEQTPLRNGFIMPQTKIALTELGFRPKAQGNARAQLEVENIRWHRLNPAQIGESYKNYELNRFNVAFENADFDNTLVLGSQTIGRSSFDVVNRGAFGYWSLDLAVKIYRGGTVLGVNKITLTQLVPGESRHVEMDWFEKLPTV